MNRREFLEASALVPLAATSTGAQPPMPIELHLTADQARAHMLQRRINATDSGPFLTSVYRMIRSAIRSDKAFISGPFTVFPEPGPQPNADQTAVIVDVLFADGFDIELSNRTPPQIIAVSWTEANRTR